jgi:hypothetical protein
MAKQTFSTGQVLTSAQMTSLQANDYNQTVSAKTASYTLAAADAGTTITMNSATATTVTVNTSLFTAGDTLRIANIGAGVCTVTAGTATVTTAGTSALVQWAGGMLYFTSASASIFFPDAVAATSTTIAVFNETQASGTAGGASVQTTYTKRTLNTTVVNNIGATLTSSVIALVAGTYRVFAMSPHFYSNAVSLRLRNTTDSTTTISGPNNYSLSASGCYTQLDGTFTITGTKNFELQYYQTGGAVATNGLGVQVSSAGISEIYGQITIEKIG